MIINLYVKMSFFIIIFVAFYYNYFSYTALAATIAILLVISSLTLEIKKKVSMWSLISIVVSSMLVVVLLINLFFNKVNLAGINLTVGIILTLILINQMRYIKINNNFILKVIWICSLPHLVATFIAIILPSVYFKIMAILSSDVYRAALNFYDRGYYVGLANQTGQNAIYLVIILGIAFVLFLHTQKKRYILLSLLSLIAILMTGKRAHLIFSLISILPILFFFIQTHLTKILKILFVAIGVLTIIYVFFIDKINVFSRFELSNNADFSSGRFDLYSTAMSLGEEHPLIGIGMGKFAENMGMHVHNIYIQLLVENGFFAAVLLGILFLGNLINVMIRRAKKMDKETLWVDLSIFFQIFLVLYGLTGNPLYDLYIFILLAILSYIYLKKGETLLNEKDRYFELS